MSAKNVVATARLGLFKFLLNTVGEGTVSVSVADKIAFSKTDIGDGKFPS
jgi:hypothetical protein